MCADAAQEAESVMRSRDAGVREVRGKEKEMENQDSLNLN